MKRGKSVKSERRRKRVQTLTALSTFPKRMSKLEKVDGGKLDKAMGLLLDSHLFQCHMTFFVGTQFPYGGVALARLKNLWDVTMTRSCCHITQFTIEGRGIIVIMSLMTCL